MAISQFATPVPNSATQPLVDTKTGVVTRAWLLFLIALWNRTGQAAGVDLIALQAEADAAFAAATAAAAAAAAAQGGADASLKIAANLSDVANVTTSRTNLQIGPATAGWVDPTGTGSRATFDMDAAFPVSNPPTQAEVQAIVGQLTILQKRLGQLTLDEITAKTIKH